jgi:hypothetical protein
VDQTIRNMITSDGPLVTLTGKETYIQYPLDKFTSFHNTLRSHNCIQHLEAIDPNELDGQMWEEQGESTSFFLQAHYQEVSFFRIRFGFWVLRLLFWFLCYSILWCASQLSAVSHICPNRPDQVQTDSNRSQHNSAAQTPTGPNISQRTTVTIAKAMK